MARKNGTQSDQERTFIEIIRIAMDKMNGKCQPTQIADYLLRENYPRSDLQTKMDGINPYLREGVARAIKDVIRNSTQFQDDDQFAFSDIHPNLMPIVQELHSNRYYVEELKDYVSVAKLIAYPAYLDSARKYMRKKAVETGKEADVLDKLYNKVMRMAKTNQPSLELV